MVETLYSIDHSPSVVRYPRGSGYGEEVLRSVYAEASPQDQDALNSAYPSNNGALCTARAATLEIGKGRVVKPPAQVSTGVMV